MLRGGHPRSPLLFGPRFVAGSSRAGSGACQESLVEDGPGTRQTDSEAQVPGGHLCVREKQNLVRESNVNRIPESHGFGKVKNRIG